MTEYRILNNDEEKPFYDLTLYAFNRPDSEKRQNFFHQLYQHSAAYVAIDDGQIGSGFLSIPFVSQLGDDKFKTSGISYVSSYPEASGKGHITKLMRKFLDDSYENGTVVSYLAPFSFPFYRRFGYEQVFDRINYHVQNIDIPKISIPSFSGNKNITIRRMNFQEAIPLITNFHNHHTYSKNGGVIREEWWNKYLSLKHPWDVVLCYLDDILSGYLIYTRHQNTTFEINELFYNEKSSMWALLQFVAAHKTAYKYFDYTSGNPISKIGLFPDPHDKKTLKVSIKPYMMARIINLEEFLINYHVDPEINDSFTIKIQDGFIEQNNKSVLISIKNGQISLLPIDNTDDTPIISIQHLTQILFGYIKPDQIMDAEFSDNYLSHLNNLQKKNINPMLWDYF